MPRWKCLGCARVGPAAETIVQVTRELPADEILREVVCDMLLGDDGSLRGVVIRGPTVLFGWGSVTAAEEAVLAVRMNGDFCMFVEPRTDQ